ncbi:YbaK/EbsC family protein [Mumia sp. zg.B17]|uniref:YbaK/EbsC family protein n=2 Tax=unclassified Mumia TaxID=2621872 RepID=UPI001C6F197C|nr:YbaK/EbsC family protein [Mumia sp. zg.B17]MBW9206248.1 YbaK/EbsC family protein [Mumia sp. zg.B17]
MTATHPRVQQVIQALADRGVVDEVVRMLPDSVRTAQEAADALGVDVAAIANSLVFDGGGEVVLVLTSGAHRVNTEALAAAHGLPTLERARPEAVRAATGQVIGGVAPVGHPAPLRTFVDLALREHEVVWAAAGHPRAVFATSFDQLVAITGGTPTEVA